RFPHILTVPDTAPGDQSLTRKGSLPTTATGVPTRHDLDTPPVDVAAYSAFYRAEIKALVNFLLWMGAGLADATDIAQETMIEAYQSWPSIRHPRAWIRRVASRQYGRRCFGQWW
ncbi:RNA polymerase sigma factor, partial [Micromonospora sp. LOL_023]|uniref:RNA polymerase sigma factor n=1 Tax=Micromonospora sp. LOL_023 TaxID=3345418 RepID=UPI003A84BA61